jgi:hypothetical protein
VRQNTGELVNAGAGRFPFFVTCNACSYMTERVRTAGIAAKLWNEAKPNNDQVTREGAKRRARQERG